MTQHETLDELGPALEDTDAATSELILQLQLQDPQELEARSYGKQKQGTVSDSQAASNLFKEELTRSLTTLSDQRMTRSIARAVRSNGNAVVQSREEEAVARRDYVMARRLSGSNLRADAARASIE